MRFKYIGKKDGNFYGYTVKPNNEYEFKNDMENHARKSDKFTEVKKKKKRGEK